MLLLNVGNSDSFKKEKTILLKTFAEFRLDRHFQKHDFLTFLVEK